MAVGFPTKTSFADGNTLPAGDLNDITGSINLLFPQTSTTMAWQAYTPTISGVTLGNATVDFKYSQIGKTVHVRGLCVMGSTSTVSGTIDVTLPVNSTGYSFTGQQPIGNVSFYNGSTYTYGTPVSVGNAGAFRIIAYNASGTYLTGTDISSGAPFTWAPATGKFFACSFTYEAA